MIHPTNQEVVEALVAAAGKTVALYRVSEEALPEYVSYTCSSVKHWVMDSYIEAFNAVVRLSRGLPTRVLGCSLPFAMGGANDGRYDAALQLQKDMFRQLSRDLGPPCVVDASGSVDVAPGDMPVPVRGSGSVDCVWSPAITWRPYLLSSQTI